MPILNAYEPQNVVFLKRSMRPGFAGIDNDLLNERPRRSCYWANATASLTRLVAAVKAA